MKRYHARYNSVQNQSMDTITGGMVYSDPRVLHYWDNQQSMRTQRVIRRRRIV